MSLQVLAIALACAAGVLGAALAAAFLALRGARRSAAEYAAEVQRLGNDNAALSAKLAAKEESIEARLADKDRACEERLAELRHTLDETIARLRSEFSALAADKLEEKSGILSERNAKDVKPLFDALRQNIDEFRKAAESTRESNVKLGGELSARIEEVGRKAQSLGRQADDFVTALRGGNKNQGNWGEGIVRNVLEGAGLRPGTDFVEQRGASDAGMPDFTVLDGTRRKILIDAKVNIDAFLAADKAVKEGRAEDAEKCLGEHAKRVRAQVVNLSAKNYPAKLKESDADVEAEYSPVVIMAMPSEATYSAAISTDPQLVSFANEHAVVLASPQMLFGYLVLFKIGMDRLKVDRNNQNIANRAKQILERIDAAFAALEKIGKSLVAAQDQYHEAMRKLGGEDGAQNILVPARELAKLATTSKKCVSVAMQQQD
jgi:DNA recombination protein RmuC